MPKFLLPLLSVTFYAQTWDEVVYYKHINPGVAWPLWFVWTLVPFEQYPDLCDLVCMHRVHFEPVVLECEFPVSDHAPHLDLNSADHRQKFLSSMGCKSITNHLKSSRYKSQLQDANSCVEYLASWRGYIVYSWYICILLCSHQVDCPVVLGCCV